MTIKTDKSTGCWIWTGALDKDGYGACPRSTGRSYRAHRVMFALWNGAPPDALVIDHKCRNRACVNPEHLRLVTPRVNAIENSVSAPAKNATKTHCVRGHELTKENTRIDSRGARCCRQCANLHAMRAYRTARGQNISLMDMMTMEVGPHNRDKTRCKRGHPLSGDNVLARSGGGRACRTCVRASQMKYIARKRAEKT